MQKHQRAKESFFKCLRSLAEEVTNGTKNLRREQEEGTESLQHLDNVRSVLADVRTLRAKIEQVCDSSKQGDTFLQGFIAAQNLCEQHQAVLAEQTALLSQYGYVPPASPDRSATESHGDSSLLQSEAASPPSLDNTLIASPEELNEDVSESSRSILSGDLPSLSEFGISAQTLAKIRHRDSTAHVAVGDALATPQHQILDISGTHSVQSFRHVPHQADQVLATPLVQHQPTMMLTASQARTSSRSMVDSRFGNGDTTITALIPASVPVNRTFTVVPEWNTPGSVLATPSVHRSVPSVQQTPLLSGTQLLNGSQEYTPMFASGHSGISVPSLPADSFTTPATAHRLHSTMALQSQWPSEQLAGMADFTLHSSTALGQHTSQKHAEAPLQASITATPLASHGRQENGSLMTPLSFAEATPQRRQLPIVPNTPAVSNQSFVGEPIVGSLPPPPQLRSQALLLSAANKINTSAVPASSQGSGSSNEVLDMSLGIALSGRQQVADASSGVKTMLPLTEQEFHSMPEYIRYQLSLTLVNEAVTFLNRIGSTSRGDLPPGHVTLTELKDLPDVGEKASAVYLFLLKANRLRVVKRVGNETQYSFT